MGGESPTRFCSSRRILLRDFSQAGDAAYLPADRRTHTRPTVRYRAEARKSGAVSIRQDRDRGQTANAFFAALLVSATAQSTMPNFARRIEKIIAPTN